MTTKCTKRLLLRRGEDAICQVSAQGLPPESLLAAKRSPASPFRHPALLQRFAAHKNWLLVRAFRREQGLMLRPGLLPRETTADALLANLRWSLRQDGAGSHRFMQELLAEHNLDTTRLQVVDQSLSEREAAAHIAMGKADAAPGVRACATEFGLGFIPTGWEAFDFALKRSVYFRALFQKLLDALRGAHTREYARHALPAQRPA